MSEEAEEPVEKALVPLEPEGSEPTGPTDPIDAPDEEDWLASEIASGTTFASSGAVMLGEAQGLHPMARSIAILVVVVAMLGFANGLDFASPEQGLVRPDEFVYALTAAAPEDSAIFRGTVVDAAGEPMEGVLLHVSWEDGVMWRSAETTTDANGSFQMENLTPALTRVDLVFERGNNTECCPIGSCSPLRPCSSPMVSRRWSSPSLQHAILPRLHATTERPPARCERST